MEAHFSAQLAVQKRDFEAVKQPMFDQIQRTTRENEALHRELDRQQDQARKMLAQF
jgi:hypothetical protein